MQQITINSFEEIFSAMVAVIRDFNNVKPWYRGHADFEWKLHPSLHHKNRADYESNMANNFINYARVRYKDPPDFKDKPSWLFLMQHYGLPTRLLDWTQSILTALYFVIEDNTLFEKDGMIWAINPIMLNKLQLGDLKIVSIFHPECNKSLLHIYTNQKKYKSDKMIAINTQHFDNRQMMQCSEFTLHGNATPLEELTGCDNFLSKIIIPTNIKLAIKQYLDLLNITESTLFPDLEHLAKELSLNSYLVKRE